MARNRLTVILFTASACGASGALAATCAGFTDDRAYLTEVEAVVQQSPQPPGSPTVLVRRQSDGLVLRRIYASERFFVDLSQGALNISYAIVAQCGGFDVRYTISNPGPLPQRFPDLRIDGLQQAAAGDIYLLKTKDYGNVQKINAADGSLATSFIDQVYPTWLYSPAIVSYDSNAAFGSALLYPALQAGYRHTVRPILQRVVSGEQAGSWAHLYHNFTNDAGVFPEGSPSMLPAGEQRELTITVRFSAPRYWLLTLFPYKQYFSSLYWADADPRPRDLRPVFVSSLSDGAHPIFSIDWQGNPRGYRDDYRVDLVGLHSFVHNSIGDMQANGYSRIMIWAPSGLYNPFISNFNFPPQFMSDWLPGLLQTQGELQAFGQQGITLGYWWGRSTQVPQPVQWNPAALVSAEYANTAHRAFLAHELTLARDRGGREIGLDYFFEMPLSDRYRWIDEMKAIAPGANFIHEGAGPDIASLKVSQFYQTPHPDGQVMEGPDVLSAYLLPRRPEIWVYFGHTTEPQSLITLQTIQSFVRWGFTPVVSKYPFINVGSLDYSQAQCFDGIDNDGDGLTDWPYDPGCATAAGLSEADSGKSTRSVSPPRRPQHRVPRIVAREAR